MSISFPSVLHSWSPKPISRGTVFHRAAFSALRSHTEIQDIRLVHSSFCSHTLKIYHFDSKIKKFNCLGWIWEKGLLFKNTIFRRNGIFLCQISLFYTITFPILIYRISNDTPTPCSYIFEIFCSYFLCYSLLHLSFSVTNQGPLP